MLDTPLDFTLKMPKADKTERRFGGIYEMISKNNQKND